MGQAAVEAVAQRADDVFRPGEAELWDGPRAVRVDRHRQGGVPAAHNAQVGGQPVRSQERSAAWGLAPR